MYTYTTVSPLGQGGFGEVFHVRRNDGAQVALKALREDKQINPDAVERFTREVRRIESLSHPNVITVLDKRLDAPRYYFVMPLYPSTLARDLSQFQGNPAAFRSLYAQLLDGVEHAHNEGILHRDLKPENILIDGAGNSIVTDFGLARDLSEEERMTHTGEGFGTHGYVAPEQWENAKTCDHRADIFSLGRILYVLAGGSHREADLERIPPILAALVRKATASEPERRYQSVAELRLSFNAALDLVLNVAPEGTIESLIDRMAANPESPASFLGALCAALVGHESDGDLMHQVVMKMSGDTLELYEREAPDQLERIIATFEDFTSTQSWAFSYTDQIGSHCVRLFIRGHRPNIRAGLLRTVLRVGTSHYRFDVMKMFGTMLQSAHSPEDAQFLASILLGNDQLGTVRDFIELTQLPYGLSRLFPA